MSTLFKSTHRYQNSRNFIVATTVFTLLLIALFIIQNFNEVPKLISEIRLIVAVLCCGLAISCEIFILRLNKKNFKKS
jgi:hypothetical protein